MPHVGEGFWKDREAALRTEWLETNGLGGYASATLSGQSTRRYHGLLVAATRPPCVRTVLLSKLEETLVVDGERFELSVNQYPGAKSPEGDRYLVAYENDPFPTFTYRAGGVTLTKTLFLVDGESTLVVRYAVEGAAPGATLEVRPLCAFRDYHALAHENDVWDRRLTVEDGRVTLKPYDALPALHVAHEGGRLDESAFWYRRFQYDRERERGFDFEEDLFSPFALSLDLSSAATLVFSTEDRRAVDAPVLERRERERRRAIEGPPDLPRARRVARRAADQFLVRRGGEGRADAPVPGGCGGRSAPAECRGDGWTVIAGYPWFTDWGRDTMIALPGLTLATGRPEIARRILATFVESLDGGMIPNRFTDRGEQAEYNTVDATLWFVEAVRAYRQHTSDSDFVTTLYPKLLGIVDAHLAGTRYGIRVDGDGLLTSGADGVQLTWMDAKVGDTVITPRRGKPVEIQALWWNALRFVIELAQERDDEATVSRLHPLAERAKASFERLFANEANGGLFDVVAEDGTPDPSVRPNQIFALGLGYPLVTGERATSVLDLVERRLLTPYGLRTLDPADPRYQGRYEGGPRERDGAYHQGTVWPWLLGPYISALLRVRGRTPEVKRRALDLLKPLVDHLLGPGLHQLPEIVDGDWPHRPNGCFAQAWSVAQLIQAVEELSAG